ncbi:hypothetical protein VTJ49DRAFT_4583 [Mycothermus thermophilus]|uniref:ABC transporter domain-containing protein n=1 Tax=Humicola insolens TaxID=85995 RepID=A0ABR3VM46_HUMIN
MATLLGQTWTLTLKNWLITLGRHPLATIIRAFLLPLVLTAWISFSRNLFVPSARYGISPPRPIRSFADGLAASSGSGRDQVVFVNGGFRGGEIERVIGELSTVAEGAGKNVTVVEREDEVMRVCRTSLRGVTPCFAAVVFRGSPTEGEGGMWNYTIRADAVLGVGRVDAESDANDGQVYLLPLQHEIDSIISRTRDGMVMLPEVVDEYPFTSLTPEEREDRVRVVYMGMVINFMGVVFIVCIIGIVYHLAGFMATERESGMSTLVEAMMATIRPWHPQAARILAYHFSFSMLYLPGWIISALILWQGVFAHTSALIIIFHFILSGLALASMTIFGAAFFKKSQLSGISITIAYILLAIIAQTISWPKTSAVVVLSLLFTPCNFTYFITYLARWERQEWPADLLQSPPESPWSLPGIAFFAFLIGQTLVYPVLGALVERWLHGTTSSGRHIVTGPDRTSALGSSDCTVRLDNFTKIYSPSPLRRAFSWLVGPKDTVVAVNGLSLTASRGQIVALLGANGSGKSTTLDTIAGINRATAGSITIDGTGGLGIAPQKNVLWDELTVLEHLRIFNHLKAPKGAAQPRASEEELRALVRAVDLEHKTHAQSRTLSGGQKRKLQLGMMLTGGSAVCCVDEVSSGLDPLSRRKIWDILLAERGRRTMILTTHFLDEADLLADHIAVMSKGRLRAQGSSAELKERLGGGYKIHVGNLRGVESLPEVEGVEMRATQEEAKYLASDSATAAEVIRKLEAAGVEDYRFSGPTIEDVFLRLADEVRDEDLEQTPAVSGSSSADEKDGTKQQDNTQGGGLELMSGQPVGFLRQIWVLFLKRCVVFKHNWFPSAAAFLIPVVAAGLVMLFVSDQKAVGCSPTEQTTPRTATNIFDTDFSIFMVAGPSSKVSREALVRLFAPIYLNTQGILGNGTASSSSSNDLMARSNTPNPADFLANITFVDTLDEFHTSVTQLRKNITPAAIWLGDESSRPTLAYRANGPEMINAWFGKWVMDMLLTNTTFASTYVLFDTPWTPDAGDSVQLLVYMGLALCAAPAFFALYPNLERRRHVRGLQYSNGVRPLPLWIAYTLFDFGICVAAAVVAIAFFAGIATELWHHVGYVFLVLVLHGLASTLLAYVVSLVSANQLSAYAITAAYQAILLLLYLIAYMCVLMFAPVHRIDGLILVVHFAISVLAPIVSVVRALFVALNLFSTACDGEQLAANPASMVQYGGPVVYLIAQSIILFLVLVWADGEKRSSFSLRKLLGRSPSNDNPDPAAAVSDEELANELLRVTSTTSNPHTRTTDGLRVLHLSKSFGKKTTAVDNVTFGIPHGEVFALLGPNGAGKSTTISLIRGDLKPSGPYGGDIFVESHSVTRQLAQARSHLGVCPQFDAIDAMTVEEHLAFYARARGVPDVQRNVAAVAKAVGLEGLRRRPAHALSGGNKRKLSLGIALMGNPSVLLLDEPSSGLDAAAKRVLWRVVAQAAKSSSEAAVGRSVLLTTHSMEEADALASRAGILAKRMLALGRVEKLRERYGGQLHAHLVLRGAPRTEEGLVERVKEWLRTELRSKLGLGEGVGEVEVEEGAWNGQVRFHVPVVGGSDEKKEKISVREREEGHNEQIPASSTSSFGSAMGRLVVLLEENKEALGIEYYSVSPTTLDQVFLTVVGAHNVQEEGYEQDEKKDKKRWWLCGK